MTSSSFVRAALVGGALLPFAVGAARADGLPGSTLHATGPDVFVTFIGYDAFFTNTLQFVRPDGTTQDIFTTGTATPGDRVQLDHVFSPGETIIFQLFTQNPNGGTWTWRSGPGSDNPDGYQHLAASDQGNGTWRGEWEDLSGGGDQDHNDLIFEATSITAVPEPVTLTLMASGLVGLSGAGLARRRRTRKDGD